MTPLQLALRRVVQRRKAKRLRRPPKPLTTKALEADYVLELRRLLAPTDALIYRTLQQELPVIAVQARVEGLRLDTWVDNLQRLFRNLREAAQVPRAEQVAREEYTKVNVHQLRSMRAQLRAVLGVDVLLNDPRLASVAEAFVAENARLIRSVPQQMLDQLETLVMEGFRSGTRPEALSQEIQERFGVAESRADLIAKDQVLKLNGQLTEDRQEQLGIVEYTWRTSKDEKVRASHAAHEGKIYRWDDPPSTGHPGQDFQCRCWPEGNLDGLL